MLTYICCAKRGEAPFLDKGRAGDEFIFYLLLTPQTYEGGSVFFLPSKCTPHTTAMTKSAPTA